MKIIRIIFLLLSIYGSAQTSVKLRDVNFKVPQHFVFVDKQNVKMNYDLFYENGRISVDSANAQFVPKIAYQYYENPGSVENSKTVLADLNAIMTKDFKPDTLVIDDQHDLSFAKYRIMGNSLFEIKSLGDNGWINIVYTDVPENDNKSFKIVHDIAYSIRHNREYRADYKQRMRNSGNATMIAIVGLLTLLLVTGIKKLRKIKGKTTP